MEPVFFKNQDEFRDWLEENHYREKEIIVGYHKRKTGMPSMTWSESVDQALCFGWIDGIRRSVDDESYCIRFTPRNPASTWSKINLKKVEELRKKGLMKQEGLDVFNKRKLPDSGDYSYENEALTLDKNYELTIMSNDAAWSFFMKQPPSYRKAVIRWIMSGKQEATRISRLNKLISSCQNHSRIY